MEIGSGIARAGGVVARNARTALQPVRWMRRHRSEFMAVATLTLMLAPLLL